MQTSDDEAKYEPATRYCLRSRFENMLGQSAWLQSAQDIPGLANRRRLLPSQARPNDAELLHTELQSGTVQPQPYGRAVGSGKHPPRLPERCQNVRPLGLFQRLWLPTVGAQSRSRQFSDWNPQLWTGAQNHRPLDHVLQLADVPRPTVVDESIHGLLGNAFDVPVHALGEALDEMLHQQRNVLPPLAQWGNPDWEDIQPVEKIGAEFLLLHQGTEISIGGGDQTRVRGEGARTAQAFELALLQHAQQFGLEFERNFANLIQEYGSPIGQLKAADALRDGAGEGAPLMSEQFTFQQARRYGGAVQFHERTRMPRAQLMQSSGNQFFSRSGLAINKDRGIGGSNGFDLSQERAQGAAPADDLLEVGLGEDFVLET